jgi:hypothetical protein
MRKATVPEHIQFVSAAMNGLFIYIFVVIGALYGYWKILTLERAALLIVPALAIELFGARSLRLASQKLTEETQ